MHRLSLQSVSLTHKETKYIFFVGGYILHTLWLLNNCSLKILLHAGAVVRIGVGGVCCVRSSFQLT